MPDSSDGFLRHQLSAARRLARRLIGAGSQADMQELLRRVKMLDRQLRVLGKTLDGRLRQLSVEQQQSLGDQGIGGRLTKLDQLQRAVVRRLYLDPAHLPAPHTLLAQRFRLWSQNEEDGLTWALLAYTGVVPRRFVEVGAGLNGGNSGFLARECGWSGLMIEGDPTRGAKLARRFDPARITIAPVFATRENINDLVTSYLSGSDVDLISIDIDGNDYWIWEAISVGDPRLVIVEYNPRFGPERAVTVPYDAGFDRHRSGEPVYYGASLAALCALGARKGYRLVVTDPERVNAFFVRRDLAPALPALSPAVAFALHGTVERPDECHHVFARLAARRLPLVDVDL